MGKFYTCYQNSSCGYNYKNEDVDKWVCVEANSVNEAQDKFFEIFKDYRDYCSCCGRRWDDNHLDEEEGYENPCIFGEDYKEFNDSYWCSKECDYSIIIYYANGKKQKYKLYNNLTKESEED